jgi:hypothetical protein
MQTTTVAVVAAPAQRRVLGTLFLLLAVMFAGIAFAAASAQVWVVVAAAAVLGLWLASLAFRALRR